MPRAESGNILFYMAGLLEQKHEGLQREARLYICIYIYVFFFQVQYQINVCFSFDWQAINYNYYYSLNAWLLLCPWWLCFDWSMGCIPLIKSIGDWRVIALAALWFCLIGLICQALCSEDSHKRR